MTEKRKYDSTVARIAGNIAAGYVLHPEGTLSAEDIAKICVAIARGIVAETLATEPPVVPDDGLCHCGINYPHKAAEHYPNSAVGRPKG